MIMIMWNLVDDTVENHLVNDMMQSVKPAIRDLLNGNQIDVCLIY